MNNNDYTRLTYQELLEDFTTRLKNDPRFAKMSSASIFYLFVELMTASMDMTNYYIQRTAEEAYLDTAKLDSSIIKLAHNIGYHPRRPVPAQAEFKIRIQGPLPSEVQAGSVVYFSRKDLNLSFNGNPFMLDYDYSYTFTEEDVNGGQSPNWSKTLVYSLAQNDVTYYDMIDYKDINQNSIREMKAYQAEVVNKVIYGSNNIDNIAKKFQYYDIDDIDFANWYGIRDPFAVYNGKMIPMNGITKIGIGENKESALDENNLFTIEDRHIYLNEDVIDYDPEKTYDPSDVNTRRICSLTSNSDKTVRLSFGDGIVVENGINDIEQNIYIEYVKTVGSQANKIGTKDSTLSIDSPIYCTQRGSVIDISNNIFIIFNSDIIGGADFESAASIKINGPKSFGSRERLISLPDFQAYFSTLTSPINVKNSVAYSQKSINNDTVDFFNSTNDIVYSIASNMYKCDNGNYTFRNVLFDDDKNTFDPFSLYGSGNDYNSHIPDYLRYILSKQNYITFIGGDYQSNTGIIPTEQWQKNIKLIFDNVKNKCMIGTNLYSIAPIVHYYDVVGNVQVNSYKDMNTIKKEIEYKIYEWLNEHTSFSSPIYKSNIIKFFNDNKNVAYADLDFKVSSLIKEIALTKTVDLPSNNNETIGTYFNSDNTDYSGFNKITIPRLTQNNENLYANGFENKSVTIKLTNGDNTYELNSFTPSEVKETNENLFFVLTGPINNLKDKDGQDVKFDSLKDEFLKNAKIDVSVSKNNDYYSSSQFSKYNMSNYYLQSSYYDTICDIITQWYKESSLVKSANRAINLPYYISIDEVTEEDNHTRKEEITRRGTLRSSLDLQLTEKSFFQRLMPAIIIFCYTDYVKQTDYKGNQDKLDFNKILTQENLNSLSKLSSRDWNGISNLCLDLYKHVKATLSDSILDDNNNIVNFTMENELPVIRLNISYKYED